MAKRKKKGAPENRRPEAAGRKSNGQFQKGKSGNPGGRPKELAQVKELARAHTVEAVETLVEVMKTARSAVARIMAADSVLNRGWGKPTQAVELTGKDGRPIQTEQVGPDLSKLSDEQIKELEGLLAAASAEPAGSSGGAGPA